MKQNNFIKHPKKQEKNVVLIKRHFFLILITVLISFTFFSCKTTDFHESTNQEQIHFYYDKINWIKINEYTQQFDYKFTNKKYFSIVKVNLDSPNLKINIYPEHEQKNKWYKPISVKKYAKKTNSFVAINTTPFSKENILFNSKVKPIGTIISNQKELFPPNEKYSALAIKKTPTGYTAKIIKSQSHNLLNEYDFAMGGFWSILENKEIIPFKKIKDIRSAIGIDESKTTIYFFIGTNFTYEECAEILLKTGSSDALQFDGGNSSALYVNNKSLLKKTFTRDVAAILGITDINQINY